MNLEEQEKTDFIRVGLIYISIVFVVWFLCMSYSKNKEIEKLNKQIIKVQNELYEAKVIAVELYSSKENAFEMLDSMNEYADELEYRINALENQSRLIKDLSQIGNKELIIALAFTESSLNYNVKHKGNKAKGICGVVPLYWIDLLKEHKVKVNSLKSCEIILNYLLDKNNGNLFNAIIEYKGIKSKENIELAHKVINIYKEIK